MHTSRVPILPLTLVLAAWLPVPAAMAAWPHDPNNGNLPVCTAANNQISPMIVPDGAGGAIVTWQDKRSGVLDIYAQRLSAAGAPLWATDGVALCTAANAQSVPTIASDGAGGAIITWQDARSGTSNDIYAQRVNAAGVPQWTANGVAVCTAAGDQDAPTIVSDGAGGAVVTWQDARSGSNNDIYAQRLNAAGVPQWTANGVALCTAANDQVGPTIDTDGAGGAIVTWQDFRSGTNNDIYAQRVNAVGVPQWTANGVALCTAANYQNSPTIVSDGAGGAIVSWHDLRGGSDYDIYAQRVNALGVTQWAANGLPLCTASLSQELPVTISDGAGGAIVGWEDGRSGHSHIYVQRVNGAGETQWAVDGVDLCAANLDEFLPTLASDGAGGAIVTWHDYRSGSNYDVYAQRVSVAGVPLWTTDGVALSTAAADQLFPAIVPDGAGGAIVAWQDYRNGTPDIYAQRVDRFGELGNPEPVITSIRDVPFDQGGQVKLTWLASYLDADPIYGIHDYRVWRSVPPTLPNAQRALVRGVTSDPDRAAREGRLLVRPDVANDYAWELVATQAAGPLPVYSIVVATTSDSVAAGNPYTAFMVQAQSTNTLGAPYWDSAPDSGYSVDNLPPVAPAPFNATFTPSATLLSWGANAEGDLAGYRLYRGGSTGFVPGPGNRVASLATTSYSDPGAPPSVYKLTAVDVHGNESAPAIVVPAGVSGVGASAPGELAFEIVSGNPAHGTAVLRLALPSATPVRVSVFDAAGRLVRTLADGERAAGEYELSYDLRGAGGTRTQCGLYFVRMEAAGRTLVRRLAVLE